MAGHLPPTARMVATLKSQLPRLRFRPKSRPAGIWTINYAVEAGLEVLLMVFAPGKELSIDWDSLNEIGVQYGG